jgi:hypothetical protein
VAPEDASATQDWYVLFDEKGETTTTWDESRSFKCKFCNKVFKLGLDWRKQGEQKVQYAKHGNEKKHWAVRELLSLFEKTCSFSVVARHDDSTY